MKTSWAIPNGIIETKIQAIEIAFPKTEIQRCIVHQIRSSTRFVNWKDLRVFSADLKTIYKAPTEKDALSALDRVKVKSKPWDKNSYDKYPLMRGYLNSNIYILTSSNSNKV